MATATSNKTLFLLEDVFSISFIISCSIHVGTSMKIWELCGHPCKSMSYIICSPSIKLNMRCFKMGRKQSIHSIIMSPNSYLFQLQLIDPLECIKKTQSFAYIQIANRSLLHSFGENKMSFIANTYINTNMCLCIINE
jgi:hypothetical protein